MASIKSKNIFYLIIITTIASGCQDRFNDISNQTTYTTLTSIQESFTVTSSIWLSTDEIVFAIEDSDRQNPNPFLIYNIEKQTWNQLTIPANPICQVNGFGFLESLPNGNIGYINTCIENGSTRKSIEEINLSTGETKKLSGIESIKVAGKFTFSTDMSEMVQEDMTGRFLSNKLYYRNTLGDFQIASNFTRAMYPDWSPHKRQIAFWGTEKYLNKEPKDFTSLPEILNLSSYPWDLYLASPEGNNVTKVLSSVEDALLINWSPSKNILAFSATVDGNSGVFLLNPETLELSRIWPKLSDFDWSPDGTRILLVTTENEKDGKISHQEINIIDTK